MKPSFLWNVLIKHIDKMVQVIGYYYWQESQRSKEQEDR